MPWLAVRRLLEGGRSLISDFAFEKARQIPILRRQLDHKLDLLLEPVSQSLRSSPNPISHHRLPARGQSRQAVLESLQEIASREQKRWTDGGASGAVYHGDADHIDFLNQVYALSSQTNPLHVDLWPSISQFEAEIVSMTAQMLGAPARATEPISGTVTSGGTESIVLALKAYRDRARQLGRRGPLEVIAPASAHAAFDKAAQLMNLKLVRVPVASDYRADVAGMRNAVNRRSLVLVASAPCFPHGVIDPIEQIGQIAVRHGLGLHVDACLGGFVLPWAERLGYPVPPFDFRVPAVTSISADTHKYGYAAKGSSVVLYRDPELRRAQYFVCTDWPGGLYFSPTLAGSRPGALSAACWAALVTIGENGYLQATRRILETARRIRAGIENTPDLYVLGDPLWVIAFASRSFDIYRVLDAMAARGWSLNGLQRPPGVHLCVTLRHTLPGVAERFLADLGLAMDRVRKTPASEHGMAPIYGMAGSFPARSAVAELLRRYVDRLYKP